MADMTGGCACGRIRYSVEIENDEAYLCHCRMCQRATGGVSVAFKNAKKAAVRWEREPDYYESSPIARRGYCAACGTSLTFEYADGESENLDLTIASFDDPSPFRPVHHFGVESMHRAWLDTSGLPEYRTDQHKPLVDRWMKTLGKLPD
ncbi:GFA family protein [Sphingosinicella sp. LY1275]|uniref:GFA family protein n=1 Tax=Sphingosinicella sp. LY1275 TaxID=3095379 RepID=UPI002ADEC84E|nr:GFA family protein [Sphingosinicella sp. LY1275]MEA1013369.1 GFA family protein [Sphingosinicella sp. LY1275]